MKEAAEEIVRVMEEWRRLTEKGDLEGVLGLMTEDAVFLTPGNPPMDRKAFAGGFRLWSEKMRIQTTAEVREVRAQGDMGYAWSHLAVVMIDEESGRRSERAGFVLSVFRRESGAWLLARDANLLMPAKT